MKMNNLTVKIDKQEFLAKPEEERSYITYSTLVSLQERVCKIENRSWWDKPSSFLGGMLGGILAVVGKTILWK